MKKLLYSVFTVWFMMVCLLPGLGMLALGPSPAAGNETVTAPPSILRTDGSPNVELLSDAAGWFAKRFAFRRELITVDSFLKANLLHTSSQSQVSLGREGWLYYTETLDDFTGADVLAPRQAYCIARTLRLAQDYAESQGAEFLFTIAPNKAGIYPQNLPGSLQTAQAVEAYSSPAVAAIERQGVHYADLFGPLKAQDEVLYFATDSHWTNKGAALAHDVLLDALGLPAESAFLKAGDYQATHRGDLYEMIYPASPRLDLEYEFAQPLGFSYARPIRDVDDLRIKTVSGSENGSLLMFRDSFGNALHSLMAESFSSAIFSRAMPYRMELTGQGEVQYVVTEIVERNLPRLAEAPFLMPAAQIEDWQALWGEDFFVEDNHSPETATIVVEQVGGYRKVAAETAAGCDTDSPVYLVRIAKDGNLSAWETFPVYTEGGTACAGYLPDDIVEGSTIRMVFRSDGRWKWTAKN
ncbi:alginate O-acetyltransferase AlgX-related protein [Acutalibacter caecimuris]|uniref:alginate O-acetyltransferase AlgX-related protein n=1 Tax=Acutalibacter caecimuris TaxID=3093657 RepID=UPI002AC9CCFA|nr:hypothetical protein [Acutalibacter sp. M00118]